MSQNVSQVPSLGATCDDGSGLRSLVWDMETLFDVAHLVGVLAWGRGVEANAGASIRAVLFVVDS